MSISPYKLGGLPFWSETQIQLRELFQQRIVFVVSQALRDMNHAWSIHRCEGPILTPEDYISAAYDETDVFVTNHNANNQSLVLRPETTASSYAYARALGKKLPLCVWQSGKSFRRELNDGARASKLRFLEFYQLEFQCIYANNTKADYRNKIMDVVASEIGRFTRNLCYREQSDRLPNYSESTIDLMVDKMEVASCSIRNDYNDNTKVCEIAIGLDRVVCLMEGIK